MTEIIEIPSIDEIFNVKILESTAGLSRIFYDLVKINKVANFFLLIKIFNCLKTMNNFEPALKESTPKMAFHQLVQSSHLIKKKARRYLACALSHLLIFEATHRKASSLRADNHGYFVGAIIPIAHPGFVDPDPI